MRKSFLVAFVAFVAFVADVAHAQFIGYVAPQTEQQTLATNATCTGSAQTFPIQNLGQTQHYASFTAVTGATKFQAVIDGVDRSGNIVQISDVLEPSGAGFLFTSGTLKGTGYYPKAQIVVTCSPNTATFTLSYSGAWATFNEDNGSYLAGQIDKVEYNGADATVNETDTFQTPFGSSAGTYFFKYGTAIAGGTLTITCSTVTGFGGTFSTAGTQPLNVTLANSSSGQAFQIPDTACPFATVAYTAPGGGTTITGEYVFAVPGLSNHAVNDPCQSGSLPKQSVAVTAAAAGTTQIIAAQTLNSIYVCGYQLSQIATAGTLQWVYGTGSSCGTGTTNLTGAMGVTASQPFSYSVGVGYVMKVPTANALCLTTTGAGGTAAGIVTYVQSP
jgi:hypothetical protein